MITAPTIEASFSRALDYAKKLTDALNDMDDCGGVHKLRGAVKAASVARLQEALNLVNLVVEEHLEFLAQPPPRPAKTTLLRRQANHPPRPHR